MKRLLLALILATAAHAASVSVDLTAIVTAHGPTAWRRRAMAFAIGGNSADWGMTRYYVHPRGTFCEANPVFQLSDQCTLNTPKFDGAKFGIDLALISEEAIHQWLKRRSPQKDANAEAVMAIGDASVGALYVGLFIHNYQAIQRQH